MQVSFLHVSSNFWWFAGHLGLFVVGLLDSVTLCWKGSGWFWGVLGFLAGPLELVGASDTLLGGSVSRSSV